MKLTLTIDKDSATDCSFSCPFRMWDEDKCALFNQDLLVGGYYDSRTVDACPMCQAWYGSQQGEIANATHSNH